MFSFPGLLWFGLLAVLVPLLHLIRFGHEIRRDWAPMSLLEAAVRKASRRTIPLQWSLVVLRTALIASLALLFASPVGNGFFPSFFRKPIHHIIVLDDTASCGEIAGMENLITKQCQSLRRYVSTGIATNDHVTLWRLSRWTDSKGQPDWDRLPAHAISDDILTTIDTIEPSDAATSPALVLSQINQRFAAVDKSVNERLVWIGDFRAVDWDELPRNESLWTRIKNRGTEVLCLFSSSPKNDHVGVKNLAVTSVKLLPGVACAVCPFEFEVSISNGDDEDATDVPVSIRVDGKAVTGFRVVLIPKRSSVQVTIPLLFPAAGTHRVEFALPPDVLACDNVYYKTVCVATQLRVLLATMDNDTAGKPESERKDNLDIHYGNESQELAKTISAALSPGINLGVTPLSRDVSTIDRQSLARCDLVVLCGYRGGLKDFPNLLNDYVKGGGNLVFLPTTQSDYDAINTELGIHGNKLLLLDVKRSEPFGATTAISFDHWTMRVFGQCEALSDSLQIKRFCPVKSVATHTEDDKRYTVTARSADTPLMLLAARGDGNVSQWFVSPLSAWSNLASHLSYPILWRDLVAWLCRHDEKERVVGEPLVFTLSQLNSGMVCAVNYSREEKSELLGSVEFTNRDRRFSAELNNISKSGFYALSSINPTLGPNKSQTSNTAQTDSTANESSRLHDESGRCFGVNVNRKESALDAATDESLRGLERWGVKCYWDKTTGVRADTASRPVADTFLILFVIVLILWELGLSNLFYRSASRRRS